MTAVLSFFDATEQIGEWSQRNFGDQKGAGALAPFIGVIEEIGEQRAAFDPEEIIDGYSDQLVYLADLAYRTGVFIDPEWNDKLAMATAPSLWVGLGQLAHAILKNHQGIRGFDDPAKFRPAVEEGVANVFHAINRAWNEDADCADLCLGKEFTRTWQRVCKRDWVANPAQG